MQDDHFDIVRLRHLRRISNLMSKVKRFDNLTYSNDPIHSLKLLCEVDSWNRANHTMAGHVRVEPLATAVVH